MKLRCEMCGDVVHRCPAKFAKDGPHVFCSKTCFGLSRRKGKSDEEKRREKSEYDRIYRAKNLRAIRRKKRAYFQRTYDPAKARVERKKRMPLHVEYCRRPEYRKWKRGYDTRYHARKQYGDFAESFLLLTKLQTEVEKRMSKYAIRLQQGTLNKSQNRKREIA